MSYNPNAVQATSPLFSAVDNLTGLPLAGGLLYTYASGTTTPQATYTDNTLTTQMPNPIVLDNYGQAKFWLNNVTAYRFNLLNAVGVQQAHYPVDNISPNSIVVGISVAYASTITPTGSIFHLTTTAGAVATINVPYTGFIGQITIIPDVAFTTTTAGNIALASTAVVGKAMIMTYDGTKWYPSY